MMITTLINEQAAWDDYVLDHPKGTFFHLSGWKTVLEKAFNHPCYFLYATENNQITGILPLSHCRSRLFSNALVSTPFCVYGGVLADNEETSQALIKQACDLARELQVDHLELRHQTRQQPNWPCKDLYYTFQKPIPLEAEANLLDISYKQRAVVRKAIRNELEDDIDGQIDDFFNVYSLSVRNLGTPVFAKRYFQILKDVFGDDCEILSVRKEGIHYTSVMSFYYKDQVLPYYGGGIPEARHVKAYDYMYWRLMRRAAERGYTEFDFGRSKYESGPYHYKRHWGFEPKPLNYEYHLVNAQELPNINPLNPKYRLMMNVWRRLPLKLSQQLGPMVSKYLG